MTNINLEKIDFDYTLKYDTLQKFIDIFNKRPELLGKFSYIFQQCFLDFSLNFTPLLVEAQFKFFRDCHTTAYNSQTNYCGRYSVIPKEWKLYFIIENVGNSEYDLYANEYLKSLWRYLCVDYISYIENNFIGDEWLGRILIENMNSMAEFWYIYCLYQAPELIIYSHFMVSIFKDYYFNNRTLEDNDNFNFRCLKLLNKQLEYFNLLRVPDEKFNSFDGKYLLNNKLKQLISPRYWEYYDKFKEMPNIFYGNIPDYEIVFRS